MIKIILGIISLVLIGLSAYSYISTNENQKVSYTQKVEKKSSIEKSIAKEHKRVIKITPIKEKISKQKVQLADKSINQVQEDKDIMQSTGRTFETIEELEEASGLADTSSDDNTPMEFEKVILED